MFDLFLLTLRTVHLEPLGPKFWNVVTFSPTSSNGRRGTAYKPVLTTKEPGYPFGCMHILDYTSVQSRSPRLLSREKHYISGLIYGGFLRIKWKAKGKNPRNSKSLIHQTCRKDRLGIRPRTPSFYTCVLPPHYPVGQWRNHQLTKLQVRVLFNCDDDYCHPYRLHHNV